MATASKQLNLLTHQYELVQDAHTPIFGLVAGYGSGKTFAVSRKAVCLAIANAGYDGIVTEPNHPLLIQILIPEMKEALDFFGVPYIFNRSEMIFYCQIGGKETRIICKSLENYDRLIGVNAAWCIMDEFDTTRADTAYNAYLRLLGRLRVGNTKQMVIVSTPEGYKAMHRIFVTENDENKRLVRARTMDNHHLPLDYIDLMRETYPAQLLEAYLEGEFVNLTSGSVYSNFSRDAQDVSTTIAKGEPLHIGLDFNIYHMAAVVHVMRKGKAHAVAEITGGVDTPAVIKTLKERYGDHPIIIYPDASGGAGSSTGAAQSDIKQLKQAGFSINAPRRNGRVKDRVASFNRALLDPMGNTRYCVNIEQCPSLALSLEQQAYDKNGDPDKSSGLDHILDAAGYFVVRQFPIKLKPKANQPKRWS